MPSSVRHQTKSFATDRALTHQLCLSLRRVGGHQSAIQQLTDEDRWHFFSYPDHIYIRTRTAGLYVIFSHVPSYRHISPNDSHHNAHPIQNTKRWRSQTSDDGSSNINSNQNDATAPWWRKPGKQHQNTGIGTERTLPAGQSIQRRW